MAAAALPGGSAELTARSTRLSPATLRARASTLLLVLDMMGTFVFAVEGAGAGVHARFDPFGVLVLAVCTALGGGIIRDVLIGATPPAALRDWRYPAIAIGATAAVVALHTLIPLPSALLVGLDAGGLSLFAVAGTQKALERGLHPLVACALGAITGVGGGTLRDILLNRVPLILHADIYATAALCGAAIMVVLRRLHISPIVAAIVGALACFTLRVVSVWQGWNLPSL